MNLESESLGSRNHDGSRTFQNVPSGVSALQSIFEMGALASRSSCIPGEAGAKCPYCQEEIWILHGRAWSTGESRTPSVQVTPPDSCLALCIPSPALAVGVILAIIKSGHQYVRIDFRQTPDSILDTLKLLSDRQYSSLRMLPKSFSVASFN
jgi:hypothetical protein